MDSKVDDELIASPLGMVPVQPLGTTTASSKRL
ncbi:hypothetical protein SALBM311S_09645 [Streptomyces alboniger]